MVTFTLPAGLFAILLARVIQMLFYEKPASPVRELIDDVKSLLRTPARLVNALPVVIAVLLCSKAMLDIKMNIPALHPFSWDETLMQFDRQLHGGYDAWQWLQPLLGHAPITFVINMAYNFWFLVMFGMWVYLGFRPTFCALRLQFFIAYAMAWVFGGALLAMMFSSAGPVYYGLIGLSPDPYVPLLDYLHATDETIPIWALDAQQMLWDGYTGERKTFLGISAFPSMHNAMTMLFALVGWRIHRTLGIWLTVYAAAVLLGSVHLAWHYAVDSYAGLLIGALSWWIAGRLVQWNMRLPQVRLYRVDLERQSR
jgi:membrane-associated phospholipid phosphatase